MSEAHRYALTFRPAAARDLRKLPRSVATRIRAALDDLRENPRAHGVQPLTGRPGLWRVRAGDYRAVYKIQDDELVILVVRGAPSRGLPLAVTQRRRALYAPLNAPPDRRRAVVKDGLG